VLLTTYPFISLLILIPVGTQWCRSHLTLAVCHVFLLCHSVFICSRTGCVS